MGENMPAVKPIVQQGHREQRLPERRAGEKRRKAPCLSAHLSGEPQRRRYFQKLHDQTGGGRNRQIANLARNFRFALRFAQGAPVFQNRQYPGDTEDDAAAKPAGQLRACAGRR